MCFIFSKVSSVDYFNVEVSFDYLNVVFYLSDISQPKHSNMIRHSDGSSLFLHGVFVSVHFCFVSCCSSEKDVRILDQSSVQRKHLKMCRLIKMLSIYFLF